MASTINDVAKIPEAFKIKTSHYVIASLSLVAALSWNETIKSGIKRVYELPTNQLWANIVYSLVITLVLILVIYMLPDTTSELPHGTQKKVTEVNNAEKIERIEKTVNNIREHLTQPSR